ncbi:MFS transporter [Paraburkholderia aromaticivorans]|uniref:MFS transporter n=1 Tax=Paraburkholderia aromaticivorans TaxID=2026199 RepID=A0A248VQ06_9BURK|nr:MFS transporter [Paraburkholderia aromaticivorans]ASW01128.1 MFS transporter [Paraburkholderia aromaticivorans]
MNAVTTVSDADDADTRRGHAYVVVLFFVCFAFSYLDRQIVSILVQPIKETLTLTDTQIGLLQGFSFTLCYATAGVFIARLIDRSNRVRLIAVCVAIWAVSTALCGFAHNFGELLAARAGTAIAEAGLSPAALSIFSDLYPPRKVTRASSVFMLGPYIGGGVALFGGGMLLGSLEHGAGATWLAGAGLNGWQAVFVAVGLPGLALAAIVALSVREPQRRGLSPALDATAPGSAAAGRVVATERASGRVFMDEAAQDSTPPLKDVLRELFVKNRFCLPYFGAYVALITLFYSHAAWFPTLLIRHFHLTPRVVGQMAAPAYMFGGILGVVSAGLLAGRVSDAAALRKVLALSALAALLLVPAAIAMPLVGDVHIAVVLYGACAFAASVAMALAPVPIQIAIPNRMRGRSIALLVFLTNAISGGLGPFAVGFINERLGGHSAGLGVALACVGGVAAAFSALLYGVAARRTPVRTIA